MQAVYIFYIQCLLVIKFVYFTYGEKTMLKGEKVLKYSVTGYGFKNKISKMQKASAGKSFLQKRGSEKDGNSSKFISFNLVIFFYKEFEIFAECKSFNQSKAKFILYSESIAGYQIFIMFDSIFEM